jgi:hypothetical protein
LDEGEEYGERVGARWPSRVVELAAPVVGEACGIHLEILADPAIQRALPHSDRPAPERVRRVHLDARGHARIVMG